jgi:DNA-binding transcriptional LysR family regulator
VESARREIGDIGRGLTGNIKIGIVPTAAQFLLPPAIAVATPMTLDDSI